jgi:hypothetical protein
MLCGEQYVLGNPAATLDQTSTQKRWPRRTPQEKSRAHSCLRRASVFFRTVHQGYVRGMKLLGFRWAYRAASPATPALSDDRRLTPAPTALVRAGQLHVRVPAVYPDSALLLFLVDLTQRGMSNLRGIRGGIESESHPLRHFFSFI